LERIRELRQRVADPKQAEAAQRRVNEVEDEIRRAAREIAKMDVERAVLQKKIDKPAPPDESRVRELLQRRGPSGADAFELERAKAEYAKELNTAGKDHPKALELKRRIQELVGVVAEAEKKDAEAARAAAVQEFVKPLRERVAKLEIDIEVQKGVLEVLERELARVGARLPRPDEATTLKAIEGEEKLLALLQTELAELRAQTLPAASKPRAEGVEAKLDLLIREVAELRSEVRELKAKK
ncbi:MAG: hypothetical protein K2V38_01110, partial [Gemmataceae bacterium]|nr:hypothetical protein [Gemmataceae bacterium]